MWACRKSYAILLCPDVGLYRKQFQTTQTRTRVDNRNIDMGPSDEYRVAMCNSIVHVSVCNLVRHSYGIDFLCFLRVSCSYHVPLNDEIQHD